MISPAVRQEMTIEVLGLAQATQRAKDGRYTPAHFARTMQVIAALPDGVRRPTISVSDGVLLLDWHAKNYHCQLVVNEHQGFGFGVRIGNYPAQSATAPHIGPVLPNDVIVAICQTALFEHH